MADLKRFAKLNLNSNPDRADSVNTCIEVSKTVRVCLQQQDMGFSDHIGQTLDDKYKIERELGRGGMGTVYLATHLGTERPVAVKIISRSI